MKPTHYDALGLERDASPDNIRAAYRQQRGALHPDREGGDAEAMAALNAAYTVLADPVTRAAYDSTLPNVERDALQCFQEYLSQHIDGDADPIKAACQGMTGQVAELLDKRQREQQTVARVVRNLSRLKFKGSGENIAARLMQARIDGANRSIEDIDQAEKILKRALEMLDLYGYDTPTPVTYAAAGLPFYGMGRWI